MKKVLLAPLFIVAATVSTAWAVHCEQGGQLLFCHYGTGCFSVQNTYEPSLDVPCDQLITACNQDGMLFSGPSVPTPLNTAPGYGAGENCANLGLTNISGKEICQGSCLWPTECVALAMDPDGVYGDPTMSCAEAEANCSTYGQYFPNSSDCSGQSGTPIIALPTPALANSMSAMQSSVSLQVTGAATVRIFDMKGTALRVQRVEKGSYVVQLSSLPRGLYIVQAASGSWKQTAKVAVK